MTAVKHGAVAVDGSFYGAAWFRPIYPEMLEELRWLGWRYEGRIKVYRHGECDLFSWEEPHADEESAAKDGKWLAEAVWLAMSLDARKKRAWFYQVRAKREAARQERLAREAAKQQQPGKPRRLMRNFKRNPDLSLRRQVEQTLTVTPADLVRPARRPALDIE